MADSEKLSYDTNSYGGDDPTQLLLHREILRKQSRRGVSLHIVSLYAIAFLLFSSIVVIFTKRSSLCHNPSLGLYSPANNAVKYRTVTFDGWFFQPSPYTRVTKEEKDENWEALYQFGTSAISKSEASQLINETLPNPNNPDQYMIQLEVFHNIHCLNMLRKALYPDQYPDLWEYWDNGTVNHFTLQARHWDHCVDQLLQTLMCNSDVTPVIFHHNFFGRGVYPQLIATHTCRDFDAISDWAKAREVQDYDAIAHNHGNDEEQV